MAEKFSRFRDPGTGIQVFLTPVAASSSSSASSSGSIGGVALILTPIFILLGLIRAVIGGICWGLYLASGSALLLRVVLFMLGFVRLPVENVVSGGNRRSVSGSKHASAGAAGRTLGKRDLVVSNHSSWIDLLIISYLYPGIQFVVPVVADSVKTEVKRSEDASTATGRRAPKKNAMSANTRIVTPSASASPTSNDIPVVGYTALSLTQALTFVGGLPPCTSQLPANTAVYQDLETTVRKANGAVAMFPEVVTSNNRALLAFNILPATAPGISSTHVLTLKYTAPSSTSTPSVYAVPGPTNTLTSHVVRILFLSNPVRGVGIRHTTLPSKDEAEAGWGEAVAGLMSSMARLKRTSLGWEAKREFLQMVVARGKRV